MNHGLKNFPPDFLERLKKIVPPGLLSEVAQGFMNNRATTFRCNTLKASPEQVLKELKAHGLQALAIPSIPLAYELTEGSYKKLTSTQAYEEGWIYLQSLSSQLPPLILQPLPGEKVLDMAAAPGGKTTQMAAQMKNEGELVAIEPDKMRFDRLMANLKRQGVKNVKAFNINALRLSDDFLGCFDSILLDAPCSSEGTFAVNDRSSWGHWSSEFVTKQSVLQKKLLAKAIGFLKPGGRLVYSTCALSPEENEGVVSGAFELFPQLKPTPIPLKLQVLKPALGGWLNQKFHPLVSQGSKRVYPSVKYEGFFVASFRYHPL